MFIGLISAGSIWLLNAIYLIGARYFYKQKRYANRQLLFIGKDPFISILFLYAIGLGGGLPALGLTTIGLPGLASIIK